MLQFTWTVKIYELKIRNVSEYKINKQQDFSVKKRQECV